MKKRRVVITGLGAISPAGLSLDDFWFAAREGRPSARPIESYPVKSFPVKIACEIKGFEARNFVPASQRKALKVMARDIQLAVAASKCAVDDSGLDVASIDRSRMGVTIGAALINNELNELGICIRNSNEASGAFSMKKFGTDGMGSLFPLWLLKYLPNMPACHISIIYDLQGPNNSITTACASGLEAVGEASRIIERDSSDRMLSGGTDSKTNPIALSRFYLMNALSLRNVPPEEAYVPFDGRRDGFVAGEGAAIVILENLDHALERKAKIYGEIAGFGSSTSFNYDHKDCKDSRGMALAMKRALDDADCEAASIDYIEAHGAGTKAGDKLEAAAIKEVFGAQAGRVPVTTFKPVTGYLSAASGPFGVVEACLAIKAGEIPPIAGFKERDPDCDLNCVSGKAQKAAIKNVLVNAFGLGGQNASLIVRRFE
ncbi:MAG: beta-ketoacyl-[acyl-carrier-protein] synthase family protein [Candidatus Omnitrophica bacterium]|nr:beta-ketoacyl-[acyl-carrier-protein] synthase family protein [Candidatus Omnitrophota bacterium]